MIIEKYGFIFILLLTLASLRLKLDATLGICMTITIFSQLLLIYSKDNFYTVDIILRFMIDMLVLYKLNPTHDMLMTYILVRLLTVALEITMYITSNGLFYILYTTVSCISMVILYQILTKYDLSCAILFKMPFFLVGYVHEKSKVISFTMTNIFNKAMYLFALNELLKV